MAHQPVPKVSPLVSRLVLAVLALEDYLPVFRPAPEASHLVYRPLVARQAPKDC